MKLRLSILLTVFALIFGLVLLGCEGPVGSTGIQGEQGEKGPQGEKGIKGDEGDEGPIGGAGPAGPAGEAKDGATDGADGLKGPTGPAGASVIIRGSVATIAELLGDDTADPPIPAKVGGQVEGYADAWLVGPDMEMYVWDITAGEWFFAHKLTGQPGPKGPQGPEGPAGSDDPAPLLVHYITFNANNDTTDLVLPIINGGRPHIPLPPVRNMDKFPAVGLHLTSQIWIFDYWYEGEDDTEPYDFDKPLVAVAAEGEEPEAIEITLNAKWTAPASLVPVNDSLITAAFTRIAGATDGDNASYYLYLDKDYSSAVTAALATATRARSVEIIGLGGAERKITLSAATGVLMTVSAANNSLTLGNNVALVGKATNNTHLVAVSSGEFIMKEGSRILSNTNNTTSAAQTAGVNVSGGGLFTMKGGIITGNTVRVAETNSSARAKAVYITGSGSRFVMEGGIIATNTGFDDPSDNDITDVYIASNLGATGGCIVKGAANIDTVLAAAALTVGENWTGKIKGLNLRSSEAFYIDLYKDWYDESSPEDSPDVVKIEGSGTLTGTLLENITLWNFVGSNLDTVLGIDDYHLDIVDGTGKLAANE